MEIIHTIIVKQSALSMEPAFTATIEHLIHSKSTINKWTEKAVRAGGNTQRYLIVECTYKGTRKNYQKCKEWTETGYNAEIKETKIEEVEGEDRWITSFLQQE